MRARTQDCLPCHVCRALCSFSARAHRCSRLLLRKMSKMMSGAALVDPTEGTWEFKPGVRLNRNMVQG